MYTEAEVKSITRTLAKYGITGDEEVKAVMEYIHWAVCLAIRKLRRTIIMASRISPEAIIAFTG